MPSDKYDTGGSFYEDIINLNLPYKQITYTNYINHFKGGSWNDYIKNKEI
jgi:hypothetical protein